jgi:hypothetical protein
VNGILVSDFYSPRFFDPVAAPGVRYSFTGAIQGPRQVLRDGYLSWVDPSTDIWWQETWFDGDHPSFRELGKLNAQNGSFRSQVDRMTVEATRQAHAAGLQAARAAGLSLEDTNSASEARAARLRQQIDDLSGERQRQARPERAGLEGKVQVQPRRAARPGFRSTPSLA